MRSWSWILGLLGGLAVLGFLAYAGLVDSIETSYAIAGGVGAAMIGAWLWLDRESLGAWGAARGTRYTSSAVLVAALGLVLAVALNVLASRYDKRWDVTTTGRFSLSDQTISLIEGLDRPISVTGFFTMESQGEKEKFQTLMEGYTQHAKNLSFNIVDPVQDPVLAEQSKITSAYGTVILKSGEDTQRLESDFDEEAVTNAIVRLTSGKDHVVCFSEGHGELDPDDDQTANGLGASIVKLEGQNYTAKKVNLLREGGFDASCEIAVIAAPQQDFMPAELEMLAAWMVGGGKAMIMLEPLSTPALARDLARYGVKVGDDVVLEQNPNYQIMGGDPSYIILDKSSFDMHPITEPIKAMALLRLARSVDKGADVAGLNVAVLAHTSEMAWAETTLDPSVPMQPDPGVDRIGSVPLAAVVEITDPASITVGSRVLGAASTGNPLMDALRKGLEGGAPEAPADPSAAPADPSAAPAEAEPTRAPGGKLVVYGDSDFAGNELVDQGNNQDLLLNTLAWLAGEDKQISIRTPEGANGSLSMNLVQGILMGFTTLLLAPGIAVGMAIGTWRRRRAA